MKGIRGSVAPGFEGVADAFTANFEDHGEVGAAVAVYVDGEMVVDLWGGVADTTTGKPYTEDTLQVVYSATKGATAVAANLLVERGVLDMDAPVTDYWPEFAANSKAEIPVRWLLSHQAGLYALDDRPSRESLTDWALVVDALERQSPLWEPGTRHGYHAVTFGFLVGELVRRITGRTLGTFFHDEIAAPLGLDFWIGLPASEHLRVAPFVAPQPPDDRGMRAMLEQLMGPETIFGRAMFLATVDDLNDVDAPHRPEFLSAELPAVNGVTNARSLARLYASLVGSVDGRRMLSASTVKRATEEQTEGGDVILFDMPTRFGLGFMLSSPFSPYGSPACFGHPGHGGSVGFGDPDAGVGFGYVMNRLHAGMDPDPRSHALIEQTYKAL